MLFRTTVGRVDVNILMLHRIRLYCDICEISTLTIEPYAFSLCPRSMRLLLVVNINGGVAKISLYKHNPLFHG